ncbi:hypothetical protein [Xenorhabdus szentirmaii]|uniref:hypothetical protein n=1 Tax=Xenorhabdus szentirmaii TaxID=290112 RepID=UPI0019BC5259|nr:MULTISPECIES: hypothetical protein [unclassified Xenorhabdus]MBD2794298.1 hypothetical protein [Xenorhabdus sp. CUL]MBD2826381.1 hypothetical protein [Xenorhabdus sp. 5]
MSVYDDDNRCRLVNLLAEIPSVTVPPGWNFIATIAVGGLTEIGFSRITNHLLIISSSGRSVIDCTTGERLARDYEDDGDWYNAHELTCQGIGPISNETVTIAGLCGGGLPLANQYGETLERTAQNWPIEELYFCQLNSSPFTARFQAGCYHISSGYITCCGFSWNGEFIVMATSSDVTIWNRHL